MHARRIGLVIGTVALLIQAATAQRLVARVTAPPTGRSLNHLGLERAWQTHVAVDSSRGALTFVTLHVSRSEWTTTYDVQYQGGTTQFDERQLDRFGRPIGVDRAHQLADVERRVLETRGITATIVERRVPSITLYAQTDRGILHAIDAETGRTKWSYSAGAARYPSLAPGANDHYVATVNGSTLYVFNLAEEKLAWQKPMGAAPGAGPALTQDTLYVPLLNGMVRGFSLADGSKVVQLRSIGRPMVQPFVVGTSLTWPTDRGYLYVVDTATNEMRFRLETNSEILGNAAYMEPNQAVVTTADGHAYAVDLLTGEKLWQFSAGDSIKTAPIVFGNRAYVVSAMGEMNAVDGEVGRQLWFAQGVRRVLASTNDRVFALGLRGELLTFDSENGLLLGQVATDYDLHIPNPISDRIYLGSSRGSLVCLRAVGQTEPILHIALPEIEDQEANGSEQPTSEGPAPEISPIDGAAPATKDASPADVETDRDDPFAVDKLDPFADDAKDDAAGGGDAEVDPTGDSPPAADPDPFSEAPFGDVGDDPFR